MHDPTLTLRCGLLGLAVVPLDAIARLSPLETRHPDLQLGVAATDAVGVMSIANRTQLLIELTTPVTPGRVIGRTGAVSRIHVAVDDPARLIGEIGRVRPGLVARAHSGHGACFPLGDEQPDQQGEICHE